MKVPPVTLYTNYITSIVATETDIQEAVNRKANTKFDAACQLAFSCLHVSD
jgi:hypothetical protein